MADVVLIQPKIGYSDKVIYHNTLPLALLSVSRLLEKEYTIKIIDQRLDRAWKKSLLKELSKNPLCVGLTSMTGLQIKHALQISRFVKAHSDIPVIWGGVHASSLPKQTLESPSVDIAIVGEGEISFYELVKALEKRKSLKGIEGIFYKKDGKVYSNPRRKHLDMNILPDIPYNLLNIKKYLPVIHGRPTLFMESSRGCLYQCSFCFNKLYNKCQWRAIKPKNVVNQIKRVVDDYNVKNIRFVDIQFFSNLKRSKQIAQDLSNEAMDITWDAQGHVNLLSKYDKNSLKLFERSNFKLTFIGVESGSQRVLNLVKKGFRKEHVIKLNKKLKEFDIRPQYNFMCGFPTETREELKESVDLSLKLIKENKKALVTEFSIFTPFPGTDLYELAKEHGFRPYERLEGWADHDGCNVHNFAWLSKKARRDLDMLHYSSVFLDKKFNVYTNSRLIRIFSSLYRPLALYRLKNNFFRFPLEPILNDFYIKYFT